MFSWRAYICGGRATHENHKNWATANSNDSTVVLPIKICVTSHFDKRLKLLSWPTMNSTKVGAQQIPVMTISKKSTEIVISFTSCTCIPHSMHCFTFMCLIQFEKYDHDDEKKINAANFVNWIHDLHAFYKCLYDWLIMFFELQVII